MQCPHCGREAPEGEYCIHCGARLPTPTHPLDARRAHAYAANPREHVLHLSAVSTLFPHLNARQTLQARWLLSGSALVIFFIALGRLVPLAIVLAALLVPVLYLAYYYVAEIYANEPLPVLLATFVTGAVLGLLMSAGFYRLILSQHRLAFGSSPGYILLTGVAVPLLAQALMLVGPLVLYFTRPHFDHLLDGLVFGAASGLGFAAAQSIIYSWLLLQGPFQQHGPATSWALPVLRIAIFVPLLDASTTGLICAAIWLHRHRRAPVGNLGWLASPPGAALAGVVGQIVPSLGYNLIDGQFMAWVWYGLAAVVLLLLLRLFIHDGLVELAQPLRPGGPMVCPHCHHAVPPDAAFCSHCGFALRASARRGQRPPPAVPPEPPSRGLPSPPAGEGPTQDATEGEGAT
jgi:hypothetical protein